MKLVGTETPVVVFAGEVKLTVPLKLSTMVSDKFIVFVPVLPVAFSVKL
ncbi:MAG: hypothetical protein R2836_06330 [Chitinophagales bacterium]